MSGKRIKIVILAYDGVQTLDLAGPLDAFVSASSLRPEAYLTTIASLDGAPLVSESGLRMIPDGSLDSMGAFDTLIVPGGASLRSVRTSASVAEAVLKHAPYCRRIVSVCTGIYGIAPTGLLDGLRVTTHWRFADDLSTRYPALQLDCDKIFIKQGRLYTSAGITAAIDLSLSLIEEDYGPELALNVARDLVVYLKRSGGQRQFSEPLRFQAHSGDRFADLAAWITSHLHEDLSIEKLAAHCALSPRQFSRRFIQAFGLTPGEKIESLRLEAARDHLSGSAAPIDAVARVVGFRSHDAFRRAFDRRFGVSPSEYRRCFSPSGVSSSEGRQ